jgi:hypothetical protein
MGRKTSRRSGLSSPSVTSSGAQRVDDTRVSDASAEVVVVFWNIDNKRQDRPEIEFDIAQLARETRCDILATAETGNAYVGLETLLQSAVDPAFRTATLVEPRVAVWTRLDRNAFSPHYTGKRFEAFRLSHADGTKTLLIAAHLRSKVSRASDLELEDTREFVADLRHLEKAQGPRTTLVVGDFNLHPWDNAMRYPHALNSVASRHIATNAPQSKKAGVTYDRFYNPSWNLLGDSSGPPGTFYGFSAGPGGPAWHVLDQVLMRPLVIPRFRLPSLRVVTTIGGRNLVGANGGLPRRGPDHLPLTFAIGA